MEEDKEEEGWLICGKKTLDTYMRARTHTHRVWQIQTYNSEIIFERKGKLIIIKNKWLINYVNKVDSSSCIVIHCSNIVVHYT